jgi:hypothetical protein
LGVYFRLIEDQLKVRPSHGFVVLGDGTRHRIENDELLRSWVLDLAARIRAHFHARPGRASACRSLSILSLGNAARADSGHIAGRLDCEVNRCWELSRAAGFLNLGLYIIRAFNMHHPVIQSSAAKPQLDGGELRRADEISDTLSHDIFARVLEIGPVLLEIIIHCFLGVELDGKHHLVLFMVTWFRKSCERWSIAF